MVTDAHRSPTKRHSYAYDSAGPRRHWTSARLAGDLTAEAIAALPTYDWQKEAFKTGRSQNYELSASGGNDKTTFYWSGSYLTQDANLINIDFLRGSTNLNVIHKISPKVTFENSIKLSTQKGRGQFGGPLGGSFLGASSFSSPLILPMVPIYKEDGSFSTPLDGGIPGILNQNIIMVSQLNKIQSVQNQAVGNVSLTWKIADGLTLCPFASIDYRTNKGDNYTDPRTPDAFNVNGRLGFQYNQNVNFLTNAVLNYNKMFSETRGECLVSYEYRSDVNEGYFGTIEGFLRPTLNMLKLGYELHLNRWWLEWFQKAIGICQAKYDFKNKYFVSATARYDGSSRFGVNNRYGLFPALSAGWLISEEPFLKNNTVLSELKLRASYGTTGNDQIGFFPGLGLVGGGANYNNLSGTAPTQMANPNLKWERNVTGEVGLEYGFFGGRISGQINYFNRTSKDLLLNRPCLSPVDLALSWTMWASYATVA
ncbi:MAG: TonB-dependent receptor [Spirosomataceae bacterium]